MDFCKNTENNQQSDAFTVFSFCTADLGLAPTQWTQCFVGNLRPGPRVDLPAVTGAQLGFIKNTLGRHIWMRTMAGMWRVSVSLAHSRHLDTMRHQTLNTVQE